MQSEKYIELDETYGAHNYHPLDVVIEKAEGVWVYDVDGHKYLDCLSAYSAVNQGHCHPMILEAAQQQPDITWFGHQPDINPEPKSGPP